MVKNVLRRKLVRDMWHNRMQFLAVILLCAGILLMLWVIAGLLMDLELLPPVDLGYEWFNRRIAPWF